MESFEKAQSQDPLTPESFDNQIRTELGPHIQELIESGHKTGAYTEEGLGFKEDAEEAVRSFVTAAEAFARKVVEEARREGQRRELNPPQQSLDLES